MFPLRAAADRNSSRSGGTPVPVIKLIGARETHSTVNSIIASLIPERPPRRNDPDPLPHFVVDIENYTNTGDLTTQKGYSPVLLVNGQAVFKPFYLFNSIHDPMPYHQIVDMICMLKSAGVADTAYKTLTIPNSSEHSFEYWNSWDGVQSVGSVPTKTVAGDVIDFLDAHLK